ncbi:MAG: hypothetical protein KA116_09835 [Proteobacteria bacterium]|nr:hypothetical protein [Pseudomonadota bacterium]
MRNLKGPFAAIDIGSNAIRLYIAYPKPNGFFREILAKRYELRLGQDVFREQRIKEGTLKELIRVFEDIKEHLSSHKVIAYAALATSALREARNRKKVIQTVFNKTDLKIRILSAHGEGKTILEAIKHAGFEKDSKIVLDLGGGSLEIVLDIPKSKVKIQSYPLGALRTLQHFSKDPQEFEKQFLKTLNRENPRWRNLYWGNLWKPKIIIGTGGNIRGLLKIWKKIHSHKSRNFLTKNDIIELHSKLVGMTAIRRRKLYNLSKDRADVIVPAAKIFALFLHYSGYDRIEVPDVSLKHGMIVLLARKKIIASKIYFKNLST